MFIGKIKKRNKKIIPLLSLQSTANRPCGYSHQYPWPFSPWKSLWASSHPCVAMNFYKPTLWAKDNSQHSVRIRIFRFFECVVDIRTRSNTYAYWLAQDDVYRCWVSARPKSFQSV